MEYELTVEVEPLKPIEEGREDLFAPVDEFVYDFAEPVVEPAEEVTPVELAALMEIGADGPIVPGQLFYFGGDESTWAEYMADPLTAEITGRLLAEGQDVTVYFGG